MALPTPNLDDRHFQDLVDEAKRQIALRCPEWTEHNVSDPGVTLIELFAFMTEAILYRLNLVPEKNYLKFLEMIGIELMPGDAARTAVTFPLAPGWPGDRVVIPQDTRVSTEPVGEEDPIIFSTDRALVLQNPRLLYSVAEFEDATRTRDGEDSTPFRVWSDDDKYPADGAAFYLGFDRDITGYLLRVHLECSPNRAVGLNPDFPLAQWQYFDTETGDWRPLPIEGGDPTEGLNNSGDLVFRIPWEGFDDHPRELHGATAWWIRYQYLPGHPDFPSPPDWPEDRPYRYDRSPEVGEITCRVLAGDVPASNSTRVTAELLGASDGTPGQTFQLQNAPILRLRQGETLEVEMEGGEGGWEQWFPRDDFSTSGPSDLHFVCDTASGEIRLGPLVPLADGTQRQCGAIPPVGRRVRFSTYRFGGGSVGNVSGRTLTVLRSAISYIVPTPGNELLQVTNLRPAAGGSDREELLSAKMRGQQKLRAQTRAVTAEDYEFHARQAVPNAVARARCITPVYPPPVSSGRSSRSQRTPQPGEVWVYLVPAVGDNPLHVNYEQHLQVSENLESRVRQYLEGLKLLTTRVAVRTPPYLWISTEVNIRVDSAYERSRVRADVERALLRFLNPLIGGPQSLESPRAASARALRAGSPTAGANGGSGRPASPFPSTLNAPLAPWRDQADAVQPPELGWPFGYPVRLVDLRGVIQAVPGVRYLESVRVFYRRSGTENKATMRGEQIELPPDTLVLSEGHEVKVGS